MTREGARRVATLSVSQWYCVLTIVTIFISVIGAVVVGIGWKTIVVSGLVEIVTCYPAGSVGFSPLYIVETNEYHINYLFTVG